MRSTFVSHLLLLLGATTTTTTHAVVLVPSSQFAITLFPTYSELTSLESMHTLQQAMESILMQTTETVHNPSLQPLTTNVVLQGFQQSSRETLPATIVTFAVLGNFDTLSAAMGPRFMDSLILQSLNRMSFKMDFVASLRASNDTALRNVVDTAIDSKDSDVVWTMNEPLPCEETTRKGWATIDVILVCITCLIVVGIVGVGLYLCRHRRRRQENNNEPAKEQGHYLSNRGGTTALANQIDAASSSCSIHSSSVAHVQFVPGSNNCDDSDEETAMRILKHHSPPVTPTKPTSTLSIVGYSPNEATAKSSSSGSSSGSSFAPSEGELSEQFSSRWFDENAQTFSIDSQDLFSVDMTTKQGGEEDAATRCSTTIASSKIMMEDWAKSIQVVHSADSKSTASPVDSVALDAASTESNTGVPKDEDEEFFIPGEMDEEFGMAEGSFATI